MHIVYFTYQFENNRKGGGGGIQPLPRSWRYRKKRGPERVKITYQLTNWSLNNWLLLAGSVSVYEALSHRFKIWSRYKIRILSGQMGCIPAKWRNIEGFQAPFSSKWSRLKGQCHNFWLLIQNTNNRIKRLASGS